MDDRDKMTLETQLLEDYRKTRSSISMEMLKSAFKVFIDHTVDHHRRTGVRKEDIKEEVEKLFEEAVDAYDLENAKLNNLTLTSWVFQCMKRLPTRLEQLQERIAKARNRGS